MDIAAIGAHLGASSPSVSAGDVAVQLPSSAQWNVESQDQMAFNQAMDRPYEIPGRLEVGAQDAPSLADSVISKMQSLSDSAAQKGEELERLITRATDTLNPTDVIAANRMMSEYYLENLMTAKLIGNATQAIERLTSLQ